MPFIPTPNPPPLPRLLVRLAIHDRLRLLHVHSIPTWKPSTGTASEPSPQIYEQSQAQKQDAAEEQRKFENAHLPSPTDSATAQNPIRRRETDYGPWRAWLQSRKRNQNAKKKKKTWPKENGLERPRDPPSHTRQRPRLRCRPGKRRQLGDVCVRVCYVLFVGGGGLAEPVEERMLS